MSEEFFNGEESAVDVRVKMIYDGKAGDIINQYVTFTRIYNEQIKLHGKTREAVLETIRICKDKNILKEYLENREKEVVNIMMMLLDKEYILKTYIESEIQEATKKAEKKEMENAIKLAQKLYKKGNSLKDIAELLDVSESEAEQWVKSFSN